MCTLSKLFSISLSLLSILSPNRVNSDFHFSGNSGHILVPGLKYLPIGTTMVLSIFVLSSDIFLEMVDVPDACPAGFFFPEL